MADENGSTRVIALLLGKVNHETKTQDNPTSFKISILYNFTSNVKPSMF